MTEQLISNDELLLGYTKYMKSKETQLISNRKYRATEKGKQKAYELHKAWFATKKDDREYKNIQNTHARARYHIRKAEKLEKFEKLEKLELAEKEKSLGIIENTHSV